MAWMIPIIAANSRGSRRRKPNTGKVILFVTMATLAFGLIIPLSIIFTTESMEYTSFLFITLIITILGVIMLLGYAAYENEASNDEIGDQTRPDFHPDQQYYRKGQSKKYFQHGLHYRRSDSRFCSNCGELLDQDDLFCYSCGWQVK